jgi:hypothetical protein
VTSGEAVSNPAGQTIAAASRGGESDVPAGVGVGIAGQTEGEPPFRHDAPPPAAEERNGVPAADDRRDGNTPEPKTPEPKTVELKTPEPAGANAGGVKPPEIRTPARAPAAALASAAAPAQVKRHAPSRRPVEQAALENRTPPAAENRNTAAQENRNAPAPDNSAPSRVFGVGF